MEERRRHPHPGRLVAWLAFVGAWSALAYAAYFAGGATEGEPLYEYATAVQGAVVFAIILGLALLIASVGGGDARALLALRRPDSWRVALGLSLLVLVATYATAAVLSQLLGLSPGEEQGLLPSEWRPERAGQYAANFLLIVTLAPIVEELMFRGLGYSLLRPFGRVLAIVGSGVAFAAAHGLVEAFPLLALFGAGLAWIRDRTGSVVPCILLHGFFNAVAMLVVLARPAT
ncbi:MAG TPA: CPBP family intramembrane glutamic endopeptidase [Gaiellaceae bacterium]|nr:CPBP family intramembrane glutamic endopeptidase [Gaiellaceae bacterium]